MFFVREGNTLRRTIEKNKRGKAEGIGEMISRSGKENSTESRQSPLSLKAPLKQSLMVIKEPV